jgi:Xaa-Pro aminopeptidase
MELARAIKSADEIKAMRCALATCESAMRVMQEHLRPGITEQALWAHLHAENVSRGGEWIETRLLASGPRTNPWFQECGSRAIEKGDLVAFDTDLIGPYGYCADISRTWRCGQRRGSNAQIDLYRLAREQIASNLALIRPGLGFRELSEKAFELPERYGANRYSTIAHGVGLCDEYPAIYYPKDAAESGYEGHLEAGMTICLESYIGEDGGAEGVKLEEQILVTDIGAEVLSRYPFEDDTFG